MVEKRCALVIHGGAGTISPKQITPEAERELRKGLQRSLDAGHGVLNNGGSSLDAVVTAVRLLEDDPLFNAGRGAVFTSAGSHEMDAATMDGQTLRAGAVGGIERVKNPILLARAVMDKSPHVMLAGKGAEDFARELGLEFGDDEYFYTAQRWQALERVRAAKAEALSDADRHGTVGAVALDQSGNLAAATSTGGNTNKWPGRIGDTPIIGAGTYANNKTCAVSATGDGEFFVRGVAGHDVSALMEYRGMNLADAARAVIAKVGALGGTGGLIAVDQEGNIALPFNTTGMYRGYVDVNGHTAVAIYR
ncbi:MAG TPA: isoaspartyl peptidase/L-asparaginase [Chthoniobacterales bacterium]|jgi:beta-aspartyl-peptidase (threonine type)|nr:isoaspartyl peptidase/L-asparaginase [Chthoniobacterales bacterium]